MVFEAWLKSFSSLLADDLFDYAHPQLLYTKYHLGSWCSWSLVDPHRQASPHLNANFSNLLQLIRPSEQTCQLLVRINPWGFKGPPSLWSFSSMACSLFTHLSILAFHYLVWRFLNLQTTDHLCKCFGWRPGPLEQSWPNQDMMLFQQLAVAFFASSKCKHPESIIKSKIADWLDDYWWDCLLGLPRLRSKRSPSEFSP